MDYTAPMTEEILLELRRRTHARQATARIELGPRWVLHPDNAVRRAGHAVVIDYVPLSMYAQEVGRVTRYPSMMDGFRVQQAAREWRL